MIKNILRFFLKQINFLIGIVGFEIIRKRAYLGENYLTTIDNEEIFQLQKLITINGMELANKNNNSLFNYFLHSKDKNLHKWFHYFEFYTRFFSPYEKKQNLKVLEIGVFKGGSLKMWKNFFPKNTILVGLDINPECKKYENPAENIFVKIGPQQDIDTLQSIIKEFGTFDIIIDDGSHISEHMIATFKYLYKHGLSDNGTYFVEDVHTNYFEIGSGIPEDQTFIEFSKKLVTHLHEPYTKSFDIEKFSFDNPQKLSSIDVTYLNYYTKAITFIDSIVVFEKKDQAYIPNHQIR